MWVTRDATTPQVKWSTTSKQYTSTKNVKCIPLHVWQNYF